MTERETPITDRFKAWRDVLPVHPAAEIIPPYSDEELIGLGRLIKTTERMNVPVIVFLDPVSGQLSLGDGRTRLDGMIAVGIKLNIQITSGPKVIITAEGIEIPEPQIITIADGFDPYAFVAATNVGRRHLNTAAKRKIGAKLIVARPELTDHAIAKLASINHKTVSAIRKEVLANGEIPHNAERVEKSGRKARGRKPEQSPKVPIVKPVSSGSGELSIEQRMVALTAEPEPDSPGDKPASIVTSTISPKTEPIATPTSTKTKPNVAPFNATEVLDAARRVEAVLNRRVSGANWDDARKEIRRVIELLHHKASKPAVGTPAQAA
jgi:hypothetical protein